MAWNTLQPVSLANYLANNLLNRLGMDNAYKGQVDVAREDYNVESIACQSSVFTCHLDASLVGTATDHAAFRD